MKINIPVQWILWLWNSPRICFLSQGWVVEELSTFPFGDWNHVEDDAKKSRRFQHRWWHHRFHPLLPRIPVAFRYHIRMWNSGWVNHDMVSPTGSSPCWPKRLEQRALKHAPHGPIFFLTRILKWRIKKEMETPGKRCWEVKSWSSSYNLYHWIIVFVVFCCFLSTIFHMHPGCWCWIYNGTWMKIGLIKHVFFGTRPFSYTVTPGLNIRIYKHMIY